MTSEMSQLRLAWHDLWKTINADLSSRRRRRDCRETAPQFAVLRGAIAASAGANGDRAQALALVDQLQSRRGGGSGGGEEIAAIVANNSPNGCRKWRSEWISHFSTIGSRRLFAIGYNLATAQWIAADTICWRPKRGWPAFCAIGKGEIDYRHWFHLGPPADEHRRPDRAALVGRHDVRILMPSLFLAIVSRNIAAQSCDAAVQRQMQFGRQQRHALGRVRIGLRGARCRADLSIPIVRRSRPGAEARPGGRSCGGPVCDGAGAGREPREGLLNFRYLAAEGASGPWGFYESLDYTPRRLPPGETQDRRPLLFCSSSRDAVHRRWRTA